MNYSTFLPVCIAFLLISSIAVLSAYAATTTNDITKIALVGDISGHLHQRFNKGTQS